MGRVRVIHKGALMQSADPLTAPSPHLRVRPDWLARREEEILDPDLPIVDPHHHLVDRENTGRYLLPDLLADTGSGHNIAAMAASGAYGKTQVCAGIVGYADLALGARVEPVLDAMIMAGGGRFRGIRFISASHPDDAARGSSVNRPAGLLMDSRIREGFAR